MFWNRLHNNHSRSLILAPIEKRAWDFLVILNSNLGPMLPRFRDLELLYAESQFLNTPPLFRPKFRSVPFRVYPIMLRSAESVQRRLSNRQIIIRRIPTYVITFHQRYRRTDRNNYGGKLWFACRASVFEFWRIFVGTYMVCKIKLGLVLVELS